MNQSEISTLVASDLLVALDCSKSLAAYLLLKYGEYDQLIDLEFNPFDHNDLMDARHSLQAVSLLSKSTFLPLKRDREIVAKEKFFSAELKCAQINDTFFSGESAVPYIHTARRKIEEILGEFDLDEFVESCNWGPGSTLNIRAHEATATRKFDSEIEISPNCLYLVSKHFRSWYPLWEPRWSVAKNNKVVTVPKNAKTDRIIAIEPSGNLWFQKGIGSMIRRRLRRNRIDLNDQGHNQRLARIGSRFNNLATIDFSSASDTISIACVTSLLPARWLDVLASLRSPFGMLGDTLVEYDKFSSMGNGYTFELESLLFYALAFAYCTEHSIPTRSISIYGDDLIVPVEAVLGLHKLFEFCGFSLNLKKSYWSSYYRESCGKHYWNGVDISPFYLRDPIDNEAEAYKVANSIRRYSHRMYSYGCEARFFRAWDRLRRFIKTRFKRVLMIPDGVGDGGLIVNFDEARPSLLRHGHQGYSIRLSIEEPFYVESESHGLLLSRLWCTKGSGRAYLNRDALPRRTRTRVVKTSVSGWYDLGPWV